MLLLQGNDSSFAPPNLKFDFSETPSDTPREIGATIATAGTPLMDDEAKTKVSSPPAGASPPFQSELTRSPTINKPDNAAAVTILTATEALFTGVPGDGLSVRAV